MYRCKKVDSQSEWKRKDGNVLCTKVVGESAAPSIKRSDANVR